MAHVVGSVDLDAMVLAIPTLAELTGIQDDLSKRPIAALLLATTNTINVNGTVFIHISGTFCTKTDFSDLPPSPQTKLTSKI